MSVERYHYQGHLESYDDRYVGMSGAELEIVTEELDELLYPERPDLTSIGVSSAYTSSRTLFTAFSHEYIRADSAHWCWPLESVTLSVKHSRFLGKSVLQQCYKVKVESSVRQSTYDESGKIVPLSNKMTSLFYIDQRSVGASQFEGRILRPNILGEDNFPDELMTVYDCKQLYEAISEVRRLADRDAQEAQAIRYF